MSPGVPPAARQGTPASRALLALLVAGGWAGSAVAEPAALASVADRHSIAPFDRLALEVFGEPELTRVLTVRPDGYVSVPLAGEVRASGETPARVAEAIRERLLAFIVEPVVAVRVEEAGGASGRGVRILGAAATPGVVNWRSGMRASDAVTAAGGLARMADGNRAVLYRAGEPGEPVPLRLGDLLRGRAPADDPLLGPGDILIIPEGLLAGDWQRELSATLLTAYTDNVDLEPQRRADPAVITQLRPQFDLHGEGAGLQGALSAAVAAESVALAKPEQRLVPDVLGTGRAELVRDRAYLDAGAFVGMVGLNAGEARSSVAGNDRNLSLVQAYQLSPSLVSRVADQAYLEARYQFGATLAHDNAQEQAEGGAAGRDSETTLSDSITNGVQVRLASPPWRRSALAWQALANASRTTRFGTGDVTAAGAAIRPEYVLSHALMASVSGGYSQLDAGSDRLAGPEASLGLTYAPTPALSVEAEAGWQLENPQAQLTLRYDPGPRTTLLLSYSDAVAVGQASLLDVVGGLAFDPQTRRFVQQQTGLGYQTPLAGITISNELTRTQRADLGFSRRSGGDEWRVTCFAARQTEAGSGGGDAAVAGTDQDSAGATLAWGRVLRPDLSLLAEAGYLRTEQRGEEASLDEGVPRGTSQDLQLRLTLTHALSNTVSGFVSYAHQRRLAHRSDDAFVENAVVVGLTRRF